MRSTWRVGAMLNLGERGMRLGDAVVSGGREVVGSCRSAWLKTHAHLSQ